MPNSKQQVNRQPAHAKQPHRKQTNRKRTHHQRTRTHKPALSQQSTKRPRVFAFIDSQNLNLGTGKDLFNKNKKKIYTGWKLDFKKFRIYLKNKFRVSQAFLFIGYIEDYQPMYQELAKFGYKLIFKPTTKDSLGVPKGNIDAELVLHSAAIEYNHYDQAVIVSGDGDFRCLYEYLIPQQKLLRIIIPNTHAQSSLLKDFQKYKTFLGNEKSKLTYKK